MQQSGDSRHRMVLVPIYELDEKGQLKPNPLFHRPIDKLHSRCIEYPYAASKIGDAKVILDVGTVKSDPVWISWLENLPLEVHATDYDAPFSPFERVKFHQADVRNLSLPDEFFDKVIAVSVIEHIGLEAPQVLADKLPDVSNDGDLEAVRELARVLKPRGELIMTVPFGIEDGLILGSEARNYTLDSIRKFELVLDLVHIEYYEYQSIAGAVPIEVERPSLKRRILKKSIAFTKGCLGLENLEPGEEHNYVFGEATWRNVPLEQTKAAQRYHVEGVACGVWRKKPLP